MPRKKVNPSLKAAMDIPEVEETIKARLPILIQRMFDLAEGVIMVETKVDGETGELLQRVYQVAPDRQALQFLIENVIGKTPQRVEMTGKDGGAIEVIPWMPIMAMPAAGLLAEGADVIDGTIVGKNDATPGLDRGEDHG